MGIAHGRVDGVRYAIVDENVPTEYDQYVAYSDTNGTFFTVKDILDATHFSDKENATAFMKEYIEEKHNKPGVMLVTMHISVDFEHETGHW